MTKKEIELKIQRNQEIIDILEWGFNPIVCYHVAMQEFYRYWYSVDANKYACMRLDSSPHWMGHNAETIWAGILDGSLIYLGYQTTNPISRLEDWEYLLSQKEL